MPLHDIGERDNIQGCMPSRGGFTNSGNTCFAGALLQLLFTMPEVVLALRDHSASQCAQPSCCTCLLARAESATCNPGGVHSIAHWQGWLDMHGFPARTQQDPPLTITSNELPNFQVQDTTSWGTVVVISNVPDRKMSAAEARSWSQAICLCGPGLRLLLQASHIVAVNLVVLVT